MNMRDEDRDVSPSELHQPADPADEPPMSILAGAATIEISALIGLGFLLYLG